MKKDFSVSKNKFFFLEYVLFVSFTERPFLIFIDKDFFEKKNEIFTIQNDLFCNLKDNQKNNHIENEFYSIFFFNRNDLCEEMPKIFSEFLIFKKIKIYNIKEAIIDIGPGSLTANRIMANFFYPILKINQDIKIKIIDHFSFYFTSKLLNNKDIDFIYNTKNNHVFEEQNKAKKLLDTFSEKIKILIILLGKSDNFFCKICLLQDNKNILFSISSNDLSEIIKIFNKNDSIFYQQEIEEKIKEIINIQNKEINIFNQDLNLLNILENYDKIPNENKEFYLEPIYLTKAVR